MIRPKCEDCFYWSNIEHGDGPTSYGVCQRYPPRNEVSGECLSKQTLDKDGKPELKYFYETSTWSIITFKNEFCGEHNFYRSMSR